MLKFEFITKERKLRKQFSHIINTWNIAVLESMTILSIFTSVIFALFSIINSSHIGVIVTSFLCFIIFLGFKFIGSVSIQKLVILEKVGN